MAKKAVFDHKISGPLMRGMHHIPVDRKAGAGAYDEALAALRAGEVIGVFPEATISQSFEVKQLKTGAARMALEAGVPIVPVTIWGTQRMWTKGRKRRLIRRHTPITIAVGPPDRVAPGDKPVAGDPADRRGAGDAAAQGAGELRRPAVRCRMTRGGCRCASAAALRPSSRPASSTPSRDISAEYASEESPGARPALVARCGDRCRFAPGWACRPRSPAAPQEASRRLPPGVRRAARPAATFRSCRTAAPAPISSAAARSS